MIPRTALSWRSSAEPMPKIKLEIDTNGDIYANGYESGLPLYGEE